jgi:ankyrin repeat protein
MNYGLDIFQGQMGQLIHESESLLHEGGSLLHQAVQENDITDVELLLHNGVYVDARNQNEATPLHVAARSDELMVVDILVKNGADLGALNFWGATPLHNACREGSNDIVIYLIKAGSDIDAKTSPEGDTPLHQAVRKNKIANIKTLILAGADTRMKNERGEHPMNLNCSLETKGVFQLACEQHKILQNMRLGADSDSESEVDLPQCNTWRHLGDTPH